MLKKGSKYLDQIDMSDSEISAIKKSLKSNKFNK